MLAYCISYSINYSSISLYTFLVNNVTASSFSSMHIIYHDHIYVFARMQGHTLEKEKREIKAKSKFNVSDD